MIDRWGRKIEYLRISVTDRCNFRCKYCMPEEGVAPLSHDDVLRFEEMLVIVKAASELGINKIRVTGGEPLVRKGITGFIKALRVIPGIEDISMTTNGSLLEKHAEKLKEAGLDRVNISLDSLDEKKFYDITRGGNLEDVLRGIDSALTAGLAPVKINCVVTKGFNEDEILDFVEITKRIPVHVRFIELMPLGEGNRSEFGFVSTAKLKRLINAELIPVEIKGNGPAKCFKIEGALGSIGFISPMSGHICSRCNRIRLTADGKLRPCLESETEYDVKGLIRSGADTQEIKSFIRRVILSKPREHRMYTTYHKHTKRNMSQIGG